MELPIKARHPGNPSITACFQDAVTDRRTQSVDFTLLDNCESFELDLVVKTNGKTNKKNEISRLP